MSVEVVFEAESHSADAIQRAAYKFVDRFALDLRRQDGLFRCSLLFDSAESDVGATVSDFRKEVLDQVLRERIRAETEGVRNLILALAFSKTDLTE